ncbi:hypothetical protein SAMN04487939_10831 [Lysobacter sp. yr284]|nr:hypothetical protein SAMN04487939_10831 [Lysobacter sp. yr284]
MFKDERKPTGVFDLMGGRKAFGALDINGRRSSLSLFDDQAFPPVPQGYEYLLGRLHNGECATLVDCVLTATQGRGRKKFSASLFPNIIVVGSRHLQKETACVIELVVGFSDVNSVFYDFDAFGAVIDPAPFAPLLRKDKAHIRPLDVGDNPIVGYFSGKFEIATVQCSLAEIKARHHVSETMGGPAGWALRNKIMVALRFECALALDEAIRRLYSLIRFFELIIGRKQALLTVDVRLDEQPEHEAPLRVFISHAPRRIGSKENKHESPGPNDVLLCTARGVENYMEVVRKYFAIDAERADARIRLGGNIRRSSYSVDRIIAAANMFDILPDSAYPAPVRLSNELEEARSNARKLFKSVPPSLERDSMLNALGRMGDLSLKRKTLSRMLSCGIDQYFPGLDLVLQEAVNCRNHYVHGSAGRIDYADNFRAVVFLTDALEFVFGVSDLIDCGWNYEAWAAGSPQADHPFGAFRLGYKDNYNFFKECINK